MINMSIAFPTYDDHASNFVWRILLRIFKLYKPALTVVVPVCT